jgi:hypothetical protein
MCSLLLGGRGMFSASDHTSGLECMSIQIFWQVYFFDSVVTFRGESYGEVGS